MNPGQVLNALLVLFLIVLTADRFVLDRRCECFCRRDDNDHHGAIVQSVSHLLLDLGLVSWGEGVPPILTSIPEHTKLTAAPARPLVVDVGLYDGQETVAAALAGYAVLSFEPVIGHIKKVQENLRKNNITFHYFDLSPSETVPSSDTVKTAMDDLLAATHGRKAGPVLLFHAAASDRSGDAHIHVPGLGQASSFTDARILNAPTEHVKVVALDDVVASTARVSVFKTDTQGFELAVLRGAERMLRRTSVCISEFWPQGLSDAGASGAGLLEEFAVRGFACFDLRGADPGRPSSFAKYTKWFIEHPNSGRWGRYGDVMCINTQL